jgi:hypothetical protein
VERWVTEEAAMAATSTLVRYEDPLDQRERGAVAGFLAGYSGHTRTSYTTDLRLFTAWCADRHVRLLEVRRAQVETFARIMNRKGGGGRPGRAVR